MIEIFLILLPGAAGVLALLLRRTLALRWLPLAASLAHSALTGASWWWPGPAWSEWFRLDEAGRVVLSVASILFLMAALYTPAFLRREAAGDASPSWARRHGENGPEAVLIGGLLFFLAAMTAVAVSRNLGLLWVAVEATTLASAPLIYFHRHHRSLEAAWKFLLISSVGIAFALLGNFFLIVAAGTPSAGLPPMMLSGLLERAPNMDPQWLRAAFIFLLIGYGTKMGLAPLHTWLPDAHSQAPAQVSALLSGALLNCAFLGVLRAHQICTAAGLGDFSGRLLIFFGVLSTLWAAAFLARQADYKRLLAYSSVENMGIIAIGAGLGGAGLSGAFLLLCGHAFAKGLLFLVAGNLLFAFGSKRIAAVRGAARVLPVSGALWFAGFLALSGLPPFGTFFGKFLVLQAALAAGRYWTAALFLTATVVAFIGMAVAFMPMLFGAVGERGRAVVGRELWGSVLPPALLLLLALLTGLYFPMGFGMPPH